MLAQCPKIARVTGSRATCEPYFARIAASRHGWQRRTAVFRFPGLNRERCSDEGHTWAAPFPAINGGSPTAPGVLTGLSTATASRRPVPGARLEPFARGLWPKGVDVQGLQVVLSPCPSVPPCSRCSTGQFGQSNPRSRSSRYLPLVEASAGLASLGVLVWSDEGPLGGLLAAWGRTANSALASTPFV